MVAVPSCFGLVIFPRFFHGRSQKNGAEFKSDAANLRLQRSLVLITGKREVKLASVNHCCCCLPGGIFVGFGVVAVICQVKLSLASQLSLSLLLLLVKAALAVGKKL